MLGRRASSNFFTEQKFVRQRPSVCIVRRGGESNRQALSKKDVEQELRLRNKQTIKLGACVQKPFLIKALCVQILFLCVQIQSLIFRPTIRKEHSVRKQCRPTTRRACIWPPVERYGHSSPLSHPHSSLLLAKSQ